MSAVGSVIGLNTFISSSNTLTVQPISGVEWVVHNIYCGDSAIISKTDGAQPVIMTTLTGQSWLANAQIHVSFSSYVTIKSTSTSNYPYAFDGVRMI